jgi:putative peptidoglycan lipid II flippase
LKSADRQILAGLGWVTLYVMLGRLAGAAKEIAIAWRFGVGPELDGYLFVLNIVLLPASIWFSVLIAVLVPMVSGWPDGGSSSLGRFAAQLLGLTVAAGLAGSILLSATLSALLAHGHSGLSEQGVAAAEQASTALIWVLPVGLLASLASAWLLAAQRHLNTLLEAVPALVVLVAVVVFADRVSSLAWATALGFALQLAVLWVALPRAEMHRQTTSPSGSSPWTLFRQGATIMLFAQALMASTAVVDQLFAARLDVGSLATLGYANRISALALGVVAIAISRSTLPVFSQHSTDTVNLHALARRWALRALIVGVLVMACTLPVAETLVRVLFERGAFTAEDSQHVASTLRVLLLQLPPYCAGLVLVSWANATRRLWLVFWASMAGFAVKLVALATLVQPLGLQGIALSTAAMYGATFLVMFVAFRRARTAR